MANRRGRPKGSKNRPVLMESGLGDGSVAVIETVDPTPTTVVDVPCELDECDACSDCESSRSGRRCDVFAQMVREHIARFVGVSPMLIDKDFVEEAKRHALEHWPELRESALSRAMRGDCVGGRRLLICDVPVHQKKRVETLLDVCDLLESMVKDRY